MLRSRTASPRSSSILTFQHGVPFRDLFDTGQQTLGIAFQGHTDNVIALTYRIHDGLIFVTFNGAEDRMRVIQPRGWYVSYEEL